MKDPEFVAAKLKEVVESIGRGRKASRDPLYFFFFFFLFLAFIFAFYQATQFNPFSLFQSSSQKDGKRSRRSGGSTTASSLTIGAIQYLAKEKIAEREEENPGAGASNILDPIDNPRVVAPG